LAASVPDAIVPIIAATAGELMKRVDKEQTKGLSSAFSVLKSLVVVWDTITDDLPPLILSLENLIKKAGTSVSNEKGRLNSFAA
jgi:hypothetical protein